MGLQGLYEHFKEEKRFFHGYASQVEYLTAMHYTHQYTSTQAQILGIDTGCDAYSLALMKEGYSLTTVKLAKKHVQIMGSRRTRDMDIITLECGTAHLPEDWDSKFDMVLCFGPLYHPPKTQEQLQAIEAAYRVCKNRGILMLACIPHDMVVAAETVHVEGLPMGNELSAKALQPHNDPFMLHDEQSIDELLHPFPLEKPKYVAADSLAELMSERINRFITEKFQVRMRYHSKTCEKPSLLGHNNHNLFIIRKNSR